MRFSILCVGSHGDIRPYIALGIGLKKRGHEVNLASHQQAEALCKKWNLNFTLVDGDLTTLMSEPNTAEILNKSSKKIATLYKVVQAFKSVLSAQLLTSLQAVKDAEVLIYSPAAFAGPHLAELLKIPSFRMILQPDAKTKQYPCCLFPNQPRLGGVGYLMGHFLAEQLLWQPVRRQINKWRKNKLQLRKMHFLGPMHDVFSKNIPSLVAFSPELISPPADWAEPIYMTNFCRIPERLNWEPASELSAFLAKGTPPLYLGFGSLTEATPKEVVAKIISVLERKKIRALVAANLPGLNQLKLSSNILPLEYVPHDWLFPRMRALIHHGGVGTIAEGLYAGKPTLVMPFLLDQFCWGKKIREWGVGPEDLAIKKFDEHLFESRLDELSHAPYQVRANQVRVKLLKEQDGVETTVDRILNSLALT